jgi:DNA-binding transcriptional regulator YdaS (Cro superfamily)
MMDRGLKRAIEAAGGARALADRLGISRQAISHWTRVPSKRIVDIERLTGVDREVLRPDLYRRT